MPVAYDDVAQVLLREVPEFRSLHHEHVRDNGEVLQHVLFGDLSRFTVDAWGRGDHNLAARVVALMERLLSDGDEMTTNLVAVSFVENIAPEDADEAFFRLYGPLLRADLEAIWGKRV